MKHFILKTILQNNFTEIVTKQNQLVTNGKHSYRIDLKDPSLMIEYATLNSATGQREWRPAFFLDVVRFRSLSKIAEKVLDFVVLLHSFTITYSDQNIMSVKVNNKVFIFKNNYVFFGDSKVSLDGQGYLLITIGYLFGRPLTDIEQNKLKRKIRNDFARMLLKEQLPFDVNEAFFKAPSWVSTIEELLIFKLLCKTDIAKPLTLLAQHDCYPVPYFMDVCRQFIDKIANYTTVTYDEIAKVIDDLTKAPKLQELRQTVASYINQQEHTFPKEIQLALKKGRDYAKALLENERIDRLRKLEKQRLYDQLLEYNEQCYLQQCHELIDEAPYEEYIVDEYETKASWLTISNSSQLTYEIDKPSFKEPVTDITAYKHCLLKADGWVAIIQNHELYMRIFARQDIRAYVLPNKDEFIPDREPLKFFVQTAENEQRRQEIFKEYAQKNAEALASYKAQLLAKARAPFKTTDSISYKWIRERVISFSLELVFVQVVKNVKGEIEILLDDGIVLGTLDKNYQRLVNIAIDEGIPLYGVIDYLHRDVYSQYFSTHVYLTNDYSLFEQHVQNLEELRKEQFTSKELSLRIVGIKYYDGYVNANDECTIRLDLNNRYDAYAVAVDNKDGVQVGYISKYESMEMALLLHYHRNNPKTFYTFTIIHKGWWGNTYIGKFKLITENCR